MKTLPAALLALAFSLLPGAAHAGQPVVGAVVTANDEYVILDTERGGRRLFVLDEPAAFATPRPGDRVAIHFFVGEDNELHARSVDPVASGAEERPGLGAVLAALATAGPASLFLLPRLGA